MTQTKVWSDGHNDWLMIETDEQQDQAIALFIEEHIEGEFFGSDEWHSLFGEEENDRLDTGTAAFVSAFLPEGFGVTQHAWDDFAIESADNPLGEPE